MKPVFKTPFLDPGDINKNDTILVYDYISNGTLKAHLHDLRTPLSWHQRLKICIDAAHGLGFLHTAHPPVIHRDVKSPNIFLTEMASRFRQR
ncbi:putative protein kinase RLK-Pelle-CrRLK1L-1 family [Helianthus annuus]|nr:putative protein kinase RLK-Pelle-CrRLK1L-1 family [Helianthus annuus]